MYKRNEVVKMVYGLFLFLIHLLEYIYEFKVKQILLLTFPFYQAFIKLFLWLSMERSNLIHDRRFHVLDWSADWPLELISSFSGSEN